MEKKKVLMRLLKYIVSKHKKETFIVLISIIVSSMAGMLSSLFLLILVDDYITPLIGKNNPDYSELKRVMGIFILIYIIGVMCTYIYNRLMVNIGQGTLKSIRDDMFSHMQKLPISYFDTHSHGEVMSLYTNDTDTLRQMISQSIPQTLAASVTILTIFSIMISLSPLLSILTILISALMIFNIKRIGGVSRKHFVNQQKELGNLNGYIEEMLVGQKVVKVFCHEEKSKEGFDILNEKLFKSADTANRYANILMPILGNIGNLHYILTVFIGGVCILKGIGGLTLGIIITFLQLTRNFTQPFGMIAQQINFIVMALAGAERIFKILDEKVEIDEGYVSLVNIKKSEAGEIIETKEESHLWAWKHPHKNGELSYVELKGDVRFFDMTFGYTKEKTVLHNLNLYAKPGQKIAFVGSTGAGKTTITNLINRFYDVADGKIRYDGININKIKKADLRHSLGIVLQDTHLFTGTIKENIRYGKLNATDDEVYQAAKLANADKFIELLPNKYDTIISGSDSELSQGQCQLIAIARAAIANPPVLILDEATSSIDTRTEKIVQQGMDALMKGRTVFVIAHRLSTIRNSDAIMVLENGRIIERGSHEELVEKKGTYYQLYTGKLELE